MGHYFEYDRLLNEEDICNYRNEIDQIFDHVKASDCLKIYGLRNFGKTSIIKNVIAPRWEALSAENRIVIYCDLYSVTSLEDISFELTKSFNMSLSKKKGLFEQGLSWLKTFTKVRPTWAPPTDIDGFGEFSLKTQDDQKIVDFQLVFENINKLQTKEKFEFLIILDEFQEIAKINKAEALLRNSLQQLSSEVPVVILGSKYHLLSNLFDTPRAPFHSWGMTVELKPIDMDIYYQYMSERFAKAHKTLSQDASHFIQKTLNHIPESINKFCEFLARDPKIESISAETCLKKLSEFLDRSRSIYAENFARFNRNQKAVLLALAKRDRVTNITGQDFLREIKSVSKSGVSNIMERFLDDSTVYRLSSEDGEYFYTIADPLLNLYLRRYKII